MLSICVSAFEGEDRLVSNHKLSVTARTLALHFSVILELYATYGKDERVKNEMFWL